MSVQLFFKMVLATLMSFFTAFGSLFGGAPQKQVCMIAHRGYSGVYHENTELAFQKAAEHGSGGAETDVRITADGEFVCSHDGEITLKDGTVLAIADHTLEELTAQPLKRKNLGEVYLCTFRRYLEVMKENDMICFIELKGGYTDEQVNQVFTLAGEVYDLSKCILQSFDFDNLLKAREQFPDLPIMLTYGTDDTGWERCLEHGFSIDADYRCVTEEMVQAFHDAGLEFAVWTCNDLLSLNYSKSLGVDYIESDVF
ncbi:MAG: hypothetical protein IJK98_06445 [Clostridia bacterium]|nr:hypothetical protein [Clostridia bacterium]